MKKQDPYLHECLNAAIGWFDMLQMVIFVVVIMSILLGVTYLICPN